MRRTRFYSRPVELGNDHDENLGENEIADAQLSAQDCATGLDFGLGFQQGRIVCRSHFSGPGSEYGLA